jgi:hypothetical protein
MAAFDSAIAEFATKGKNVKSTWDDKIEREVFRKESNIILFPHYITQKNTQYDDMDLQVVDEHEKIKAFIELDRSGSNHIDHYKFISLLERKVLNVLTAYQIAPVLMVYLNKSMTRYFMYSFQPEFLGKYPLQKIDYTKEKLQTIKKERNYPKHPRDYQHRIDLKHGEYRNIGGNI